MMIRRIRTVVFVCKKRKPLGFLFCFHFIDISIIRSPLLDPKRDNIHLVFS